MAVFIPSASTTRGTSAPEEYWPAISPSQELEHTAKRPAEHELWQNPRPRRPRLPDSYAPPSPAPYSSLQLPDPSLIQGLIRKYNKERLYVRPLYWTSQQLQLLECQFVCEDQIHQRRGGRHSNSTEKPVLEKAALRTIAIQPYTSLRHLLFGIFSQTMPYRASGKSPRWLAIAGANREL